MKLPKGLSIVYINAYIVAKLYDTNIIELDRDTNCLKLRTGGWKTRHTKKCMNLFLNKYDISLVQEEFNWNLYRNGELLGTFEKDTLEVFI